PAFRGPAQGSRSPPSRRASRSRSALSLTDVEGGRAVIRERAQRRCRRRAHPAIIWASKPFKLAIGAAWAAAGLLPKPSSARRGATDRETEMSHHFDTDQAKNDPRLNCFDVY